MDFRQNLQNAVNRSEAASPAQPTVVSKKPKADKKDKSVPGLLSVLALVVLIGSILLILGAAFFVTRTGVGVVNEAKLVDTSKYQAVFLNNGQVYFGKVTALNGRYVNLQKVFYLTQSTDGQGQATSDYTLVKLGCQQIHYPSDQMVISRDQVTFWENLNKDGKVAKSIDEFKKQNPNGENCQEVSNQTQSSNVPTQSSAGAAQTTTPTTNSSTNTTTTPTPNTNRR